MNFTTTRDESLQESSRPVILQFQSETACVLYSVRIILISTVHRRPALWKKQKKNASSNSSRVGRSNARGSDDRAASDGKLPHPSPHGSRLGPGPGKVVSRTLVGRQPWTTTSVKLSLHDPAHGSASGDYIT